MSENQDGDKKLNVPSQSKYHFLGFSLPNVLLAQNENDANVQKFVRPGPDQTGH